MDERWDRERWRTVAERLLASDMAVNEWCAANRVSPSALYRRLAWFRDNEPGLFGGPANAHAGDGTREWVRAARAAARGSLPPAPAPRAFVEVELPAPAAGRAGGPSPRAPIVVEARGAVVTIPPGSAREDVEAVLAALVPA